MFRIIKEEDRKKSTWSGGTTEELFIYPNEANYQERNFNFRISIATTELEESIFTKLPNTKRIISVLEGKLELSHKENYNIKLEPYDIDRFSGEWDTHAKGKVKDFNLMIKKGNGDFHFNNIIDGNNIEFKEDGLYFIYLISDNLIINDTTLKVGELLITDIPILTIKGSGKIFYGFATK